MKNFACGCEQVISSAEISAPILGADFGAETAPKTRR
jgi:hypothetical protein